MKITIIPTLSDNYTYLLESKDGNTAIVDAGEAQPIINALESRNLRLDTIFCTHHHYDHIDGIPALKETYSATLIAPEKDKHRIPNIDQTVKDGDIITWGNEPIHIIETPGHTTGHICLHAPQSKALFCADTLFSMGCGRLFEGTAQDMHRSLQKLAALPGDTNIYPGHEYTLSNAEFCNQIEPKNPAIEARLQQVKALRAANKPTIPATLDEEKQTNLFLNTKTAEQFAQLRSIKDNF